MQPSSGMFTNNASPFTFIIESATDKISKTIVPWKKIFNKKTFNLMNVMYF
jgi:hypothetical protein